MSSLWRLVVAPGVLLLVVVLASAATSPSQHQHSAMALAPVSTNFTLLSLTSTCSFIVLPGFFHVNRVDTKTGTMSNLVFNTSLGCELMFYGPPAPDPLTKRAYTPVNVNHNPVVPTALYVLDFADPNQGVLNWAIPLPVLRSPLWYFYSSAAFDQKANAVWMVAFQIDLSIHVPNLATYLVKVDLTLGTSYNVTALPDPGRQGVEKKARGVFNPKTRNYLLPMYQVPTSEDGELTYLLGYFDVDLNKFTRLVNNTGSTHSMFYYSRTATVYGFLSVKGSIGYAKLDPLTGDWRIINQYHNHTYKKAYNMVLDNTAGYIYGELDNWFAVVDVESGDIKSLVPLPSPQQLSYTGLFGL